jgi:acyl-CoA thioesterase II
MTRHLFELLALRRVESKDGITIFESVVNPESLGRSNKDEAAFGGFAIGLAFHAACHTLSPAQLSTATPQSMLGNFLAPVSTREPLRLSVSTIRDTRSFATRQVIATQQNKQGKPPVVCHSTTIDFIVSPRNLTLLTYSLPMSKVHPHHSKLSDYTSVLRDMVKQKKVPEAALKMYLHRNDGYLDLFETKVSPGGVTYDTAGGSAVSELGPKSNHAKVPVWERNSANWFRLHHSPEKQSEDDDKLTLSDRRLASACSLSFVLDMLVFATIMHSFFDFQDVSAAASMDFALRFHCDDLDTTRWHFRELTSPVAADERAYNEAKCWQEDSNGNMQLVATMTQAGIFRRKKEAL